ncbi:AraC family transcriptional regulator [Chitinophaga pendula]|uniref:AraC family transcriptional regulator n=1 Tax=Chitinophaga TaxID=79328 RepID=UPI000BB04985|nr:MULTISPECIES: AraC family transcriptional regulator [Chitinophaga]ASZ12123.1 AraC family transcriptional regulator [Chitinophaga sp. MD30]UCJ04838.1 AraC family transcriptional regulator [Chitinophaga pendula]
MNNVDTLIRIVDEHPTSIVVMRQQTEQRLPSHQHDKGQLLLVFGGIAYLQTAERDFYIPSSHYIWIPGQYAHNLVFNTQDLFIINIYFPNETKKAHAFYDELGIYSVSRLLSEMLAFCESWQGNFFANSWEYEFLITLKHLLPKENLERFSIQLPTTDDQRLNQITDYLRGALGDPVTLENTASRFGFSVRSLTRLFQSRLNTSFTQYLKMLRIIRAMELLKDTELSISEIAYEVGYSGISLFSNNFIQLTNMRPSAFRAML